MPIPRRRFLKRSAALIATTVPGFSSTALSRSADKNSRPVLGMIGCGGKGRDLSRMAAAFGDFAAVCDVDRTRAERYAANPKLTGDGARKIDVYRDYRKLLEREDIDAVICAPPDHWHTAIYVAAIQAGKHAYGEKPMTLTIDEGKILRRVVGASKSVFQVGNQQRSCQWFRQAVAIAQSGMLGTKLTATCNVGTGLKGGPFSSTEPPTGLDWDFWLGQAPYVPYIKQRCHSTFRWWREYSGGKLTDWGAHHIDIAQWAIGAIDTGPVEIEGEGVFDERKDCYNTAQTFKCTLTFANGNKILVQNGSKNGIRLEGEKGSLFVDRQQLSGELVKRLAKDRVASDRVRVAASALYDGPYGVPDEQLSEYESFRKRTDFGTAKKSHMGNFFNCIVKGGQPISDVATVQRSNTSCHLCNIAMLLGRKLRWDPKREDFIGDTQASAMLAREQRKPYTIDA